jgi:CBS domain-containing protein
MFVQKRVRDLMIPLERYSVTSPDSTLKDAVLSLRTSYCQLDTGICTEAGPRTVLVVNEKGNLEGILDFRSILGVLIPEVAGGLSKRVASLSASVTFAEADSSSLDDATAGLNARVQRNAGVKVRDMMLKVRGTIQAEASLMDALKLIFKNKVTKLPVFEGDKLVGILRDTDLFLAVGDILT